MNEKNSLKEKKILFALNEQQRKDLLETAKNTNYKHFLIIKTQLESGLRISELTNLLVDDLDTVNSTLLITSKKGGKYNLAFSTKTITSNRAVPIPNNLCKELRAFIGARKTGYIFETQKKNEKNKGRYNKRAVINLINSYAKHTDSIKKKIGSHTLRRTYASFLLQQKIEIGTISTLLGHKNIGTTVRYLYGIYNPETMNEIKKVIKKMNVERKTN